MASRAHHLTFASLSTLAAACAALLLAGCASKPPQGYGVAVDQSTAAQAQQQMEKAEQSTQLDPQQTYLNLIAQMQQANQWFASLAHTDAFERQYGSNTQVRLLRADALRNTGQAQQAEAAYRLLVQDADTSIKARARRGLGLLYASQERYAQAITQLEAARQLDPINADVLSDLAYAHMLDGRLASAALPIQQAAQLAPSNTRVQLNLALFWLASGAQTQASQVLQRLRQPQSKNSAPPIDETSVQMLQSQLTAIQGAVRARANASTTSGTVPHEPSAPAAAQPAAASGASPAPGPLRTIVISTHPLGQGELQESDALKAVPNALPEAPALAAQAETSGTQP